MVKFCGNLTWYTALTTSWNPITNQFRLDGIHTAMYPRYCMLSVQGIENVWCVLVWVLSYYVKHWSVPCKIAKF